MVVCCFFRCCSLVVVDAFDVYCVAVACGCVLLLCCCVVGLVMLFVLLCLLLLYR